MSKTKDITHTWPAVECLCCSNIQIHVFTTNNSIVSITLRMLYTTLIPTVFHPQNDHFQRHSEPQVYCQERPRSTSGGIRINYGGISVTLVAIHGPSWVATTSVIIGRPH